LLQRSGRFTNQIPGPGRQPKADDHRRPDRLPVAHRLRPEGQPLPAGGRTAIHHASGVDTSVSAGADALASAAAL